MIAQKKATLKFFQEMEQNIYDRARGIEPKASRRISGTFEASGKGKVASGRDAKVSFMDDNYYGEQQTRPRMGSIGGPPRRIRTISTVDGRLFGGDLGVILITYSDEILLTMRQNNHNERFSNSTIQEEKRSSPRTVPSRTRTGSSDFPDEMPLPIRINSSDVVDVSSLFIRSDVM